MARSRNIKPGFFKNEHLAELPADIRLLFIGLWLLADREGRLEDRPRRIKGELFPFDSFDVDPMLDRLSEAGFLVRYQGKDLGRYIEIVNFVRHQDPHYRERASVIPPRDGKENQIIAVGVTRTMRERILERDGRKCLACGSERQLCIDHIVPISRGGSSQDDNLQVLCLSCNTEKGNKESSSSQPTRDVAPSSVEVSGDLPSDSGFSDSLIPDSLIPETLKAQRGNATTEGPESTTAAALSSLCAQHRVKLDARGKAHVAQWAEEGLSEAQLEQAIAIARERKPDPAVIPIAYLLPIVAEVRAGLAKNPDEPRGVDAIPLAMARIAAREEAEEDEAAWWKTAAGIQRQGMELGIEVDAAEAFSDYTARVLAGSGSGPWLDQQPPVMRDRIEHYLAIGWQQAA